MPKNEDEIAELLGFNDAWFEIGVLDKRGLKKLEKRYRSGEDPYTEHYRWIAFTEFLEKNRDMSEEKFRELFQLGQSDADLGGTMIRELLEYSNCPIDIVDYCLNSEEKFLRTAAEWAIARKEKSKE